MIKKIIIIFLLIFSIGTNAFSKSPPLGTGSLVPSNIMIMLDNSGSMGWNLAGNELSTVGELNRPAEIKNDSEGNIYVLQYDNTKVGSTNYRMHVFDSDGTLKRRMLPHQFQYPVRCGQQTQGTSRFDIYDDKIYILDQTYYQSSVIHVLSKTGQCLQIKRGIDHPRYGSRSTPFRTIAVSENYVFL